MFETPCFPWLGSQIVSSDFREDVVLGLPFITPRQDFFFLEECNMFKGGKNYILYLTLVDNIMMLSSLMHLEMRSEWKHKLLAWGNDSHWNLHSMLTNEKDR